MALQITKVVNGDTPNEEKVWIKATSAMNTKGRTGDQKILSLLLRSKLTAYFALQISNLGAILEFKIT